MPLKCKHCGWIECECMKENNWEKEFEDNLIIEGGGIDEHVDLESNSLNELIEKYIQLKKVKIKCKDGCIQIERIK